MGTVWLAVPLKAFYLKTLANALNGSAPLGRLIAACEVLDCLLTGTSPPLLLAGRARPAVCRAIDGKRGVSREGPALSA
jgi:hypothetical protein